MPTEFTFIHRHSYKDPFRTDQVRGWVRKKRFSARYNSVFSQFSSKIEKFEVFVTKIHSSTCHLSSTDLEPLARTFHEHSAEKMWASYLRLQFVILLLSLSKQDMIGLRLTFIRYDIVNKSLHLQIYIDPRADPNSALSRAEAERKTKNMIFYGLAPPIEKLHKANEVIIMILTHCKDFRNCGYLQVWQ